VSESYVLYLFHSCPYCARVRRFLERERIEMPMRDIQLDPAARRELIGGGGSGMVPCLQITHDDGTVEWMYESLDIIDYLQNKRAA